MITTVNLEFSVSGQTLTTQQEMPYLLASNTVKYVKAHFELDENWQSVETVSAVWSGVGGCYSMVLDDGGNCFVPQELLAREQRIYVNLVGSDVDNDEVVDRITTYPVNVINVNATAYTCGSETVPLTPSQFEQYVAIVSDLVHSVKDIDRIELNEDYTLTVYYSDGTSWTSTSIRGEQGETGNGVASAVLNDDYTLTLTFTDGTSYTTSSIRGAQGPQGEPGEVTLAQLEQVLPTDTASGSIASFPDGSDLFDCLSCVVEINPVQAGSGTTSPDNVRPITGWTGCNLVVSPTQDAQDGTTYPTTWQTEAGTVYGGTVDLVTGVLTVTHGYKVYDGSESGWNTYGSDATFWILVDGKKTGWQTSFCNAFNNVNYAWALPDYGVYCDYTTDNRCYFRQPNVEVASLADWETWLENNPVQICYELATPQTYQLTGQQIACLLGQNNVWADCGNVEVQYKADVQRWVEKKLGQ